MIRLDHGDVAFREATVISVPAGTIHGFRFHPGTQGWVVTLPETVFAPLRASLDPVRRLRSVHLVSAAVAPPGLDAMIDEHLGHAPLRGEALHAHLTLLIVWVLRQLTENRPASTSRMGAGKAVFDRFLALLDDAYARSGGVGAFARALSVSAPHLSRVCRSATGKPASALIRERRLLEARRLLAYTQVGIADIAERLGYADPAHFARVFSKETGRSPRAFRKEFTDTPR